MHKKGKFGRIVVVVVVLSVLLVGLSMIVTENSQCAKETVTVAAIYIGPIGDYGWSFVGHRDLTSLAKTHDWIEYFYAEAIPYPEAEGVIRDFIDKGATVIFAHSFGYKGVLFMLAEEFPHVKFHYPGGFETLDNVATYYWNEYEVRFLTGVLSGMMTETNILGFIGAHPILRLIWGINAYILGVQQVNPDAVVHVVFVGDWYDPPREKEIAHALIDLGVDFISYHTDSPAAGIAAEERGVYAFGNALDLRPFAPEAAVTTALLNWTSLFEYLIQGARYDTWETGVFDWGMAEDVADMAPLGEMVPEELRARIKHLAYLTREGWLTFPRVDDPLWE